MNTSYNYADFIGIDIDSNIEAEELQEQNPSVKQGPDKDKHIQVDDIELEIPGDPPPITSYLPD
ncbi:MAG: hypothetical protein ACN4GM_05710 [Gammaproteobacteria bacterium]